MIDDIVYVEIMKCRAILEYYKSLSYLSVADQTLVDINKIL